MNRIFIAVLMLLLAGIICGCEIFAVSTEAVKYSEELNNISFLSKQENFEEANNVSEDLLRKWKNTTKHFDKYLYHDYIDDITRQMSALPVFTKNKDLSAIEAQIEEIKIQLTSLKESELPYLHNIL